ncbi:MAG: hypothetical protein RLZZ622_895 [Planctomycetota bacterium]
MAASFSDPSSGGMARLLWRQRSLLGAVGILAGGCIAGWVAWQQLGGVLERNADSLLTGETIEVVGIPDWITSDLKWQALRSASLDTPLPLDDPSLERRLARAFDMHPWVAQVVKVETRHPAAATVTIRCRVPVAMVRVQGGLLAIDAEATVLPSADFTPEAAAEYPLITGITTSPRGPEGSPWGDRTVAAGAALTAAIGPEWQKLGLTECRAIPAGDANGGVWWELLGVDDLVIVFGRAPGEEQPGDASAATKIARLAALADRHQAGLPLTDTDLTKPTG